MKKFTKQELKEKLGMKENDIKYKAISNKYLAYGLAFANFKFQKHEENGKKIYTFENNKELNEVIDYLTNVRNKNKFISRSE